MANLNAELLDKSIFYFQLDFCGNETLLSNDSICFRLEATGHFEQLPNQQ